MAKLGKTVIRNALPDSGGVVSTICKRLDCSTTAYYVYEEKNPDIKEERLQARASGIGAAEETIFKAAREGNLKAAMFVLKTIGKDRGYVERTENIIKGDINTRSEIMERAKEKLRGKEDE